MSIDRGKGEEDVAHIRSAIAKNEIMPFSATWMGLEIVQQRRRYIMRHPLYVESKKKWHKRTYLQNRKKLTDLENEILVARRKDGGGRNS